jgi:hypothetical protein
MWRTHRLLKPRGGFLSLDPGAHPGNVRRLTNGPNALLTRIFST